MKLEDFDYEDEIKGIKQEFREENLKSGMYSPYGSREPTTEDRKRYYKLYPHQGTYFKGHKAGFFDEGKTNPYYDYGGQVTFRRAHERNWKRGYEDGQKLRKTVLET